MATWKNVNTISEVFRDENGIESAVLAPNVYSETEDAMLYKLYLYVLENTTKPEEEQTWKDNFDTFASDFKSRYIFPNVS